MMNELKISLTVQEVACYGLVTKNIDMRVYLNDLISNVRNNTVMTSNVNVPEFHTAIHDMRNSIRRIVTNTTCFGIRVRVVPMQKGVTLKELQPRFEYEPNKIITQRKITQIKAHRAVNDRNKQNI